jgi:hypothetical protein
MRVPALLTCLLLATCGAGGDYVPRQGDIIFHTSRSAQSLAIQKATGSPYSHMGIVYVRDGKAFVFEAVQPVKQTPLARWIARGDGGHYVVKRLRDADRLLDAAALERMRKVGEQFRGRAYDLTFEWSDERIYCSELVWKIYQRALGLEIGALQSLAAFDLSDPAVQAKMRERWGGPPPASEQFISPAAMFASDLLETVHER